MTDTLTYPEGTQVLITGGRLITGDPGIPEGTVATVLENFGPATGEEALIGSIIGIDVQEGDEKLELSVEGARQTYSASSREVELVPVEVAA